MFSLASFLPLCIAAHAHTQLNKNYETNPLITTQWLQFAAVPAQCDSMSVVAEQHRGIFQSGAGGRRNRAAMSVAEQVRAATLQGCEAWVSSEATLHGREA